MWGIQIFWTLVLCMLSGYSKYLLVELNDNIDLAPMVKEDLLDSLPNNVANGIMSKRSGLPNKKFEPKAKGGKPNPKKKGVKNCRKVQAIGATSRKVGGKPFLNLKAS